MIDHQRSSKRHTCIVNVGIFRSGTTTLFEAAKSLGLKVSRKFPDLSPDQYSEFLLRPEKLVLDWLASDGRKEVIGLALQYDLICDGWIALLPFLPPSILDSLKQEAADSGVLLKFVATTRDVESITRSELQHWTIHDLERKAGLTRKARENLESSLRARAENHQRCTQSLKDTGLLSTTLPLANVVNAWSKEMSLINSSEADQWEIAFHSVGKQNCNPPLPVEGILLTLRLGNGQEAESKISSVEQLLEQIEQDCLCQYLVVLAIDDDEKESGYVKELVRRLVSRSRLSSLHQITNPKKKSNQPFAICLVWHAMANIAWRNGAAWVMLLGDDIKIECSFHYRVIYRAFLDIARNLKVPFGFGCPWWNDATFPGFPSFPCVGKTHFEIFSGLIPENRRSSFINQDLDPYLQRLYTKFMAAPCLHEALLFNEAGGNIGSGEARYERVHAQGWRDFVQDDVELIRKHLPAGTIEAVLVDVVVPSFRVKLDYLQSICCLKVPEYFRTFFIIVVDNPEALLESVAALLDKGGINDGMTLHQGERILEKYLSKAGNTVFVRCNKINLGASASRNYGLNESAAEFVLHLDDDLIPRSDLLEQYGRKLQDMDNGVVGLVGLVRFPRSSTLPLRHAAVLMSYLTFMFEIAERNMYDSPAWGVTANILFRRTSVRFDIAYAKTGGGEDVDFSLSVRNASNGGKLLAVPEACVVHPFWPGSAFTLSRHFFNWAIGDGALFKRFPNHCYWSFPNAPEMLMLLSPLSLWFGPLKFLKLATGFVVADFVVDASNQREYKHRCQQLQRSDNDRKLPEEQLEGRSRLFYFSAHCLANIYVLVLECGRLWGHTIARKDPMRGIFRRFDWHCGQLINAPSNFRKREAYKFSLFVGLLMYEFGDWQSQSCRVSSIGSSYMNVLKDVVLTMVVGIDRV